MRRPNRPRAGSKEGQLVTRLKVIRIVKIELATGLFVHRADASHVRFSQHTDWRSSFDWRSYRIGDIFEKTK